MPDYKRKKVKRNIVNKKKNVNDNKIKMSSKKSINDVGIVPEKEIKVVRGAKYTRNIKNKFLVSFVLVLAFIYFIFHLILPVNVHENIVNSISVMGHGQYPNDISGTSVIDCISSGHYYYVLSDTSIAAYSNNGKTIFNELHGFSNPIIATSETRAIVYDQGGKLIYVYNLGGKIHTLETQNEIITANVSREGTVAVSTHSDSYTSQVNVYDKNLKKIFTWNSAKDIVNNVLVNPAGNRLAVSTLSASSGQYTSKMMILNFESADPIHTVELGNSPALSLVNTGRGISVITSDKYKFIHWKKFSSNEFAAAGEINIARKCDNGILMVINRPNDRSDNTVVLMSKKGVKKQEFSINNFITDIQSTKGRVYYISDTMVNILNSDGSILRSGKCEYGAKKIAIVSANAIATVTDSQIFKTDIDKE